MRNEYWEFWNKVEWVGFYFMMIICVGVLCWTLYNIFWVF